MKTARLHFAIAMAWCSLGALVANAQGGPADGKSPLSVVVTKGAGDDVIIAAALAQLQASGFDAKLTTSEPGPDRLTIERSADGKFLLGTMTLEGTTVSTQRFIEADATASELSAQASALVDELVSSARTRRAPSTLIVECDPAGIALKIDRNAVLTCGSNSVAHGRHSVWAAKSGYRSGTFEVNVPVGGTETLYVSLERQERSRALWYWAGGLAGAGVLTASIGIVGIATHTDAIEGGMQQPEVKDRRGRGIALTLVGAGLIGAGVAVGVLAHRRDREGMIMPVPIEGGGAAAVWLGSF